MTRRKPPPPPAKEAVSAKPPSEPSYAEALRDSQARGAAQKPFRKLFGKCKSLDQLAALLAKHRDSHDSIPWLSWICDGPGEGRTWTHVRDKPDAKRQARLVRILEELIEHGAELALVDEEAHRGPHALARLVQLDELTAPQRVALLELAIEHGADPGERIVYPLWGSESGPFLGYQPTRSALDVALDDDEHPELLAAILRHVSAGVLEDAYLRHAIAGLTRWIPANGGVERFAAAVDRAGGRLDRFVTRLDSCQTGALVHFLCGAEVRIEYFDRVIDRLDASLALPGALTIHVAIEWGLTPTLRVPEGATPLDLVDAILGFVTRAEAANARKPSEQFRADTAATIRELARHKRDRLLARGAEKSARPERLDLPPVLAETGEQLLRLAKLLGTDEASLREAMSAIDTGGMGPWGFLRALVPRFEAELVSPELPSPLAHLLTAFTTDRWSTQLRRSELPAAERAAVELAVVFHRDDDASMLAVKTATGTQIWRLAGDAVTVVAPSVPAYLQAELDRWRPAR